MSKKGYSLKKGLKKTALGTTLAMVALSGDVTPIVSGKSVRPTMNVPITPNDIWNAPCEGENNFKALFRRGALESHPDKQDEEDEAANMQFLNLVKAKEGKKNRCRRKAGDTNKNRDTGEDISEQREKSIKKKEESLKKRAEESLKKRAEESMKATKQRKTQREQARKQSARQEKADAKTGEKKSWIDEDTKRNIGAASAIGLGSAAVLYAARNARTHRRGRSRSKTPPRSGGRRNRTRRKHKRKTRRKTRRRRKHKLRRKSRRRKR